MYRYFELNNSDIFLPESIKNIPEYFKSNFLWSRETDKYELNNCFTRSFLKDNYIFLLYGTSNSEKYCFNENAIEKYYSLGGNFSYEELNNIKYSRLLKQEYLLNEKSENTAFIPIDILKEEYLYNGM